eukprot:Rhum_TRINITY_DN1667_c0_g1::Rhum_TRINITY_DN1667_c0_g1_i1::g.4666::m.4666
MPSPQQRSPPPPRHHHSHPCCGILPSVLPLLLLYGSLAGVADAVCVTRTITCSLPAAEYYEFEGPCRALGYGPATEGRRLCGPGGLAPSSALCALCDAAGAFTSAEQGCAERTCDDDPACGGLERECHSGAVYPVGTHVTAPAVCTATTRAACNAQRPHCSWAQYDRKCEVNPAYRPDPVGGWLCRLPVEAGRNCTGGAKLTGAHCKCSPTTACGAGVCV